MHLSRPVGWQDTAQEQNFEFPRENQCYKMRNRNGSASFLLLCSGKKWSTLDWTCLGCREEPARSHGILIPLGLGEARTWQGHFLGLFLPQCWEEVTWWLLLPKNKAWGSWSQSSCKHLGVCSQLLQTSNSLIKLIKVHLILNEPIMLSHVVPEFGWLQDSIKLINSSLVSRAGKRVPK